MARMLRLPKKHFELACLECRVEGVFISAETLENFYCAACNAEFSLQEVRGFMGEWARFLAWLDKSVSNLEG